MRWSPLLAIVVLSTFHLSGSASDESPSLVIRANPDVPWGGRVEDVEKVLYSAAEPLWRFFPDKELKPILVEPKGGPILLYKRGASGEFQVLLNTGNRLWAQQAFQFAHEFCHVLCEHKPGAKDNLWFEESLCETASLFVLRRMAETWQTNPPYPNWKDYSPALTSYANDLMKNGALPAGKTLAEWYREHEDLLSTDPVNRNHNLIVGTNLLELFENQPTHWEAISYLNGTEPAKPQSFTLFLNQWHQRCPARHQEFVEKIGQQFEITIQTDPIPARDQIKARYDREIEELTTQIHELRKKRDAELKELFQQEQQRKRLQNR